MLEVFPCSRGSCTCASVPMRSDLLADAEMSRVLHLKPPPVNLITVNLHHAKFDVLLSGKMYLAGPQEARGKSSTQNVEGASEVIPE